MMFLLRCLFWLGLVFSQIAEREGSDLSKLTQPAAQSLAQSAQSVGAKAVEACRDHAAECLAVAAQASQFAAPAKPAQGQDTLRESDRLPAWRLRGGV